MEKLSQKLAQIIAIMLLGVLSFTFIADWATSPHRIETSITAIDDNIEKVAVLTASAVASSTLISAIPDDTGTPVANELAELTDYFLIILSALYLEKFLAGMAGIISFKVLIPFACFLLILSIVLSSAKIRKICTRIVILAIAIYIVVPISITVTNELNQINENQIEMTIAEAEQYVVDASMEKQDGNIFEKIKELPNKLAQKGAALLNHFLNTVAIFFVTSCVVPILVMMFLLYVLKHLLSTAIPDPMEIFRRFRNRYSHEDEQ